ncbi:acyl-CoA thioesterase [Desulfovibrio inopinatus]|uniref:acyl-CoA thioesterase n=1 Tax=Desulfovibrio inopinatus TaxID=102109 RepID=UPI00041A51D2|nr:acyl-CoA thioesterase [Desulfovibrio inopinatus]
MKKNYFRLQPNAPAPLEMTMTRPVKFHEADPLGIVWHGNYVVYFEEGREAFGAKFGINYLDFHNHGLTVPIRRLEVDYLCPLRYGDHVTVMTRLHWSDAARLNFEYRVTNQSDQLIATGCTVQLFVDLSGELVMTLPDFLLDFQTRWYDLLALMS